MGRMKAGTCEIITALSEKMCLSVPDPATSASSFLHLRGRFAAPYAVHGGGTAGAPASFPLGGCWHLRHPPSPLRMPCARHSGSTPSSLLKVSPLPPRHGSMMSLLCPSCQQTGSFFSTERCSMVMLRNWQKKKKKS